MTWHLTVVAGNSFGARVQLAPGDLTIGRGQGEGLVLDDARASRVHCRVSSRGEQIVLIDLGSTNGTQLNGEPITGEVALCADDTISIGESQIRVERTPSPGLPAGVGPTTKSACCRQTEVLIERSLDGELSDRLRLALDDNLASCARCAEQAAVAAGFRLAIDTSLVQAAPDYLEGQVRKRLGLGADGT